MRHLLIHRWPTKQAPSNTERSKCHSNGGSSSTPKVPTRMGNVVLVHGGWVHGSGWEGVHNILTRDGHHVSIVQIPTLSFADDVMATRRVIDAQDGPGTLVGHSYGGAVITGAGNDANVPGLVHIAAF